MRKSTFHSHPPKRSDHLVGKCKNIKRETGCVVKITSGTPHCLTIKPSSSREGGKFDTTKAKEIVEDSLLSFVECDGARARLLYELALSLDSGQLVEHNAVMQRDPTSNHLVWMKLLDLPAVLFKQGRLVSFRDDLQRRVQLRRRIQPEATPWSAKVFGHGLDNMITPLQFCKPFVLVCAPTTANDAETVARSVCPLEDALELVWNTVDEYHRRHEPVTLKFQRWMVNMKRSRNQRRANEEPHCGKKERSSIEPHCEEKGSEGLGPGLLMGSCPGSYYIAYGITPRELSTLIPTT